jgi:hypothetical protein
MRHGLHRSLIAAFSLFVLAARAQPAAAQVSSTENLVTPRGTGRIWNLSDRPLTYRVALTGGSLWSSAKTIEPGKYHEFRVPKEGARSSIRGLADAEPSITVSYQDTMLDGAVHLSLPARTPQGQVVPNWYFITDSNGWGRMVQSASEQQARERQAELRQAEKYSKPEVARIKRMLRANFVLFD